MAGPATLYQSGDHASRPATGSGCVLYSCTTHGLVYRDDGSAWSTFMTLVGGMANPMTTAGDLVKGGATGAPERLAVGSDGQVLKVVAGAPAWAADSGGSGDGWPSGYHPDRPPVSGTTLVDEFDDSSLDAAWGWVAAGPPASVSESLYPGHLYLESTGSPTTTYLRRNYAPGATDFTIGAKCAFTTPDLTSTGGMGIGIALLDSSDAVIWYVNMIDGGATGTSGRMQSTATALTAVSHGDGGIPFYLAIQRTSANVYTAFYSFNGINWGKHGSSTVATAVAKVALRIDNNAASAGNPRSASVDFLRVLSSLTNKLGS